MLVPERGADPVRTLHDGIVTAVHVADARDRRGRRRRSSRSARSRSAIGRPSGTALGTSLSGGQTRLANERQKYENQRRADEQELRRLQQRVVALESQAALKERQAAIAREVAARQQRSYEEGLIELDRCVEAEARSRSARRRKLEQVRAESAETRAAMRAPAVRDGVAQGRLRRSSRAASKRSSRARTTRKGMLDGEASRDGNALTVAAPCAGTVVKLLVKNARHRRARLDVLAEIVCRDERLQAELMVPQRGLALLRAGQPVKLRYDAFPYQRYGVRYAHAAVDQPVRSSAAGARRVVQGAGRPR